MIDISITVKTGNKVKYDYDNDGGRWLLEQPYRPKWKSAKFVLPTGKKKNEIFPAETTDEEIIKAIYKKYSNLKFTNP